MISLINSDDDKYSDNDSDQADSSSSTKLPPACIVRASASPPTCKNIIGLRRRNKQLMRACEKILDYQGEKNTLWGWFSPCLHGKSKSLKRGALDLDQGRGFHLVCMASAWYWGLSRGHSSVLPTPGPSWKNWHSDIGHSCFFFVSVLFIINISDNICKKHLNSLMEVSILLVNLFECVDLVGLANLCVRGERFTRHHLRSVH